MSYTHTHQINKTYTRTNSTVKREFSIYPNKDYGSKTLPCIGDKVTVLWNSMSESVSGPDAMPTSGTGDLYSAMYDARKQARSKYDNMMNGLTNISGAQITNYAISGAVALQYVTRVADDFSETTVLTLNHTASGSYVRMSAPSYTADYTVAGNAQLYTPELAYYRFSFHYRVYAQANISGYYVQNGVQIPFSHTSDVIVAPGYHWLTVYKNPTKVTTTYTGFYTTKDEYDYADSCNINKTALDECELTTTTVYTFDTYTKTYTGTDYFAKPYVYGSNIVIPRTGSNIAYNTSIPALVPLGPYTTYEFPTLSSSETNGQVVVKGTAPAQSNIVYKYTWLEGTTPMYTSDNLSTFTTATYSAVAGVRVTLKLEMYWRGHLIVAKQVREQVAGATNAVISIGKDISFNSDMPNTFYTPVLTLTTPNPHAQLVTCGYYNPYAPYFTRGMTFVAMYVEPNPSNSTQWRVTLVEYIWTGSQAGVISKNSVQVGVGAHWSPSTLTCNRTFFAPLCCGTTQDSLSYSRTGAAYDINCNLFVNVYTSAYTTMTYTPNTVENRYTLPVYYNGQWLNVDENTLYSPYADIYE